MRIVCKSALDNKQIDSRVNLKVENVEIQLLNFDFMSIPEVEERGINVTSIHTPLINHDALYIEDLLMDNIYDYIHKLISGLNAYRPVTLVFHSDYIIKENSLLELSRRIKELYSINDNISFTIENSSFVRLNKSHGVTTSKAFGTYPVEMVKQLRELVGTDRIYNTLDITHAESSIKGISLFGLYGIKNIEKYFELYSETTNICHFAKCRGTGIESKDHGIGFSNYRDFKKHYELFLKYMPNADLVIEMCENDYIKCPNLSKTIEYIDIYNKKK